MLPTPSTSHISFDRVYEPAEDSFLLLDTLSSHAESAFLHSRFSDEKGSPLVVEIGTGSGVVLAFITANAESLLGRRDVLSLGTDINAFASSATRETVQRAIPENCRNKDTPAGILLGSVVANLASPIRPGSVDILIFNPPYVPTEEVPNVSEQMIGMNDGTARQSQFEHDSFLLSLSYAGGHNGMEVTNRLLKDVPRILDLSRGVAYILLCAQNRPKSVKDQIRAWNGGWKAETVGSSGKTGGWEKLEIVRVWRDGTKEKG
jgi:release factor glutamine methyltransferase